MANTLGHANNVSQRGEERAQGDKIRQNS
jgi:hypothetical protein